MEVRKVNFEIMEERGCCFKDTVALFASCKEGWRIF